jgi:hypothetical protein
MVGKKHIRIWRYTFGEVAALPASERVIKVGSHCWIGYPAAQAALARRTRVR